MIDELKSYVWRTAAVCPDASYPPNSFRMDHKGRLISWGAYGNQSHPQGWQIGYIQPATSDSVDTPWNCRAESWQTNQDAQAMRKRTGEYPLFAPAAPRPAAAPDKAWIF